MIAADSKQKLIFQTMKLIIVNGDIKNVMIINMEMLILWFWWMFKVAFFYLLSLSVLFFLSFKLGFFQASFIIPELCFA
jgi:hypothetical protein